MDHSIFRIDKGAVGQLKAGGEAPKDLFQSVPDGK